MGIRWTLVLVFVGVDLGQTRPDTPENLKAPPSQKLMMRVRGSGDQIYSCDGSQWIFVGPEAKLSVEGGKPVGSHFAGPTWQWSDGSRVVGKVVATATPDGESIPWLLLTATDHVGDGVMQSVSSIQRLNTSGGKAPASGCDVSRKDEKVRVHYTADYYFYRAR